MNKPEKTYSGKLMEQGKETESIIINWLQSFSDEYKLKEIIDCREFKISQRLDVDLAIETMDGKLVLAEIKSDVHIKESGNLFFEINRINHFVPEDLIFYLGWSFRSPAKKLICRNPDTKKTFVFNFSDIRKAIGRFFGGNNKAKIKDRIRVIETDKQKTTIGFLLPMKMLPYQVYDL